MGEPVAGVLLAGGRARRMGGGDKCLRPLAGRSIITHVIERARPQLRSLLLNANGDPDRFSSFGLPVAADLIDDFAGPLAGILTGLRWIERHASELRWMVSLPTDTPFLPLDLVKRLEQARAEQGADLACAASNDRTHPVVGLWNVGLADELERAMREEGMRKIDLWTARYRTAIAHFDADPFDPFFNANTPEDLRTAERLLESLD